LQFAKINDCRVDSKGSFCNLSIKFGTAVSSLSGPIAAITNLLSKELVCEFNGLTTTSKFTIPAARSLFNRFEILGIRAISVQFANCPS